MENKMTQIEKAIHAPIKPILKIIDNIYASGKNITQHKDIFTSAGNFVFPAPVNIKNKVKPMASKYCTTPINLRQGIDIFISSWEDIKNDSIWYGKIINSDPIVPIIKKDHFNAE